MLMPVIREPALPSAEDLLAPVQSLVSKEDNRFYSALHNVIWKFVGERFGLSGSEMNKQMLVAKMNVAGIDSNITGRLFNVLEQCEGGMFTNASLEQDKQSVLSETKKILEVIHPAVSSQNLL
jgi:hypothetical protein